VGKCYKHGNVFTVLLFHVVTGSGQNCIVVGKCSKEGSGLLWGVL